MVYQVRLTLRAYPDLISGELNYTAIAISKFSMLPVELRMQLHEAGRTEDILAACIVSAVESYQGHYTSQEARNAAGRAIYHALKSEGYHREYTRNQNYERRELLFSQVQNPTTEILEYITNY